MRQVATDTSGQVWDSLTSSQVEPRKDLLDRLGRSKELPTTDDLEKLWYELQREMTEQGQVVRYRSPVLTIEGQTEERDVVRAGPFSAVSRLPRRLSAREVESVMITIRLMASTARALSTVSRVMA